MSSSLSFIDTVWNMAVTQATIGYGDLFPWTDLGRIFSVCAALAGLFTGTLMQTVALRKLKMSVKELQFVAAMKKKNKIPTSMCAMMIARWWQLVFARRHCNPKRFNLLLRYMDSVWTFRVLVRQNVGHDYLEFHQLLHNTDRRVAMRFTTLKNRLKQLRDAAKVLAKVSTNGSAIVSKLMYLKSSCKGMLQMKRKPTRRRPKKLKSTLITSMQRKQASDSAYRNMLQYRFGHRSSTEKWGDCSPLLSMGDATPTTESGSWNLPPR